MCPRRREPVPDPFEAYEQKIKALESELYSLRSFVIGNAPELLARLLEDYVSGSVSNVVEQVIEAAEPMPQPFGSDEALCPLCKGRSSAPYAEGFKLPIGLERHLIGYYTHSQCQVMKAADSLARGQRKVQRELEEYKRQDVLKKIGARAASTAPFYQTGPECPGELKEEVRAPRDESELVATEAKLQALGFEIKVEGRLRSYIRTWNDLVVYADPRPKTCIRFRVFFRFAMNDSSPLSRDLGCPLNRGKIIRSITAATPRVP